MNFEGFAYGYDFEQESNRSPLTGIPYHGLSPDHFYPDTPPPPAAQFATPQPPVDDAVLPWVPSPPEAFSPPTPYAAHQRLLSPEQIQTPPPVVQRQQSRRAQPQTVRFDEAQLAMAEAENADRPKMARQEISQGGGQVTPGIDDTPFIQYALEALTREDGLPLSQSVSSTRGSYPRPEPAVAAQLRTIAGAAPIPGIVPAVANRDSQPVGSTRRSRNAEPTATAAAAVAVAAAPPVPFNQPGTLAVPDNTPSFSSTSTASAPAYIKARSNLYGANKRIAVPHSDVGPGSRYGNRSTALTHLPPVLRLPSFLLLTTLNLVMIAALILSAAYSKQHDGLLSYPGTPSGGHYFCFASFRNSWAA
ncbi:unnamed protein product [Parascedosporium putredinis]|uniref:Uncharacterized protein n=1 Tax=Parascedosporium putredinis TaxID=1442378 RepID=A0A9P1GVG9_9PEZI|nr:unnamed protein product [Parascedosporium putredinis]CAI7988086.1 unnamed protein product [Parascedosporium putredinis]